MHFINHTMNFSYYLRVILCALALAALPASAATDVSAYGAKGDGHTDDTNALQFAINSTPIGGTLTFGGSNQTYLISSRLVLLPNRIYQGQGTIRMNSNATPHIAIAMLAYNAANGTTISGITFDANGVGGGLQVGVNGAAAIPADGLQLNHVVFRNTSASPTGPWDGALYVPVGLTNSQITNNQIVNCGYGLYLADLNAVTISNNYFQQIHYGDAISVVFNAAPFAYGQNIVISQNTGQHLGRMGIELWPNGGNVAQSSPVTGVVISGNTFSEWDMGFSSDTFGISVMAGQQHSIVNNKLVGTNVGYGIEVGSQQCSISQNTVSGFSTGIILHDSASSNLSGNLLTSQTLDGIEFSNAPGSRSNTVVQNNSIIDAQVFGIFVNTPTWGGSTFTGNFISRTAGVYPADQNQSFTGIATTPPLTPVTVSGNSITQASVTGPAGFGFIGIRLNGGVGSNASSSYQNNTILSQLLLNQSFGLFGNSAGTMNGTIIQGNTFTGLNSASGGAASSGAVSSGNMVYNCTFLGPITLVP
jgi:parallel beta-helix repeat protein